MSAPTQFFKSSIQWNNGTYQLAIPALPNAVINCPRNFAIPPLIGNDAQVNYVEGFRQPMVDVALVQLDQAASLVANGYINPLGSAFLNYLRTRSADAAYDTTAFGDGSTTGLDFWDGRSGFTLLGAKFEQFTVGTSKGDDLRLMARFTGASIIPITVVPTYPAWSNASVLRFQSAAFGSTLANLPWSFEWTYSNNHNPNMALNGTSFPLEMNAGLPTSSFSIMTQAVDSDGFSFGPTNPGTVIPDGALSEIPAATPQTITISNAFNQGGSATKSFVLTLANIINDTRDNRSIRVPRNMRLHNYIVTATAGNLQPWSYTSTF